MLTIILASILISIIFAQLGCIVLWKKYIYFGDGLSHASLLAGSITIISSIPVIYSGIIVAILFAVLIFKFKTVSDSNAVISLVSSFMLSLALLLMNISSSKINIDNLLFGDIISTCSNDIIILFIISILVTSFVLKFYNQIILIVLNRDIAKVRGLRVEAVELMFLILLSLSIFSTIKIVGALLVTSIILIPALTARLFAANGVQMILYSVIIALISNLIGLFIAFHLDILITPIIIIIGVIFYSISYISIKIKNRT